MNIFKPTVAAIAAVAALSLGSCTDLDENLYDQVGSENYYNTKNDVIRAVFRPFEHAFWSIGSRHVLNELTADQLITPTRDDGGTTAASGSVCITTHGPSTTWARLRPNGTVASRASCSATS